MRAYFTALLFSAVAGGIAAAVVAKPFQKHLRFLASLICTALIVAPVLQLVPQINISPPQAELGDISSYDLAAEQAAEDACTALENYIFAETGIKVQDISIQIERVEGQLYLHSIKVKTLKEDCDAVYNCLYALFGHETETEVYW